MTSTIYVFTTLACLALTSLTSVRADGAKPNQPEHLLPSQNQIVDCPKYENCNGTTCHFNGSATEPTSKRFDAGDTLLVTCDSLKVDIEFPASKDTKFDGKKTWTCFKYDNENGTSFNVAEVILNKPDDVKGSQVVCTFNGINCTIQNDTSSELILVAGFPSNCTLFIPTTTSQPEATTAAPTTPTTQTSTQSSASKSGESTTTHMTAGNDTGTGSTAPSTKDSKGTTASSEEKGKGDSSVARLEFAAVLAMAVALFVRHYL